VQPVEARGGRVGDGLVVAALVQLGIADQHPDAGVGEALHPQPEGRADGERQPVPERAAADLRTGDQHPVRVVAERGTVGAEARQQGHGQEALGGEHGVVGHRAVPLGEQEPIAAGHSTILEVNSRH
jgi:hypothetical protein